MYIFVGYVFVNGWRFFFFGLVVVNFVEFVDKLMSIDILVEIYVLVVI